MSRLGLYQCTHAEVAVLRSARVASEFAEDRAPRAGPRRSWGVWSAPARADPTQPVPGLAAGEAQLRVAYGVTHVSRAITGRQHSHDHVESVLLLQRHTCGVNCRSL